MPVSSDTRERTGLRDRRSVRLWPTKALGYSAYSAMQGSSGCVLLAGRFSRIRQI